MEKELDYLVDNEEEDKSIKARQLIFLEEIEELKTKKYLGAYVSQQVTEAYLRYVEDQKDKVSSEVEIPNKEVLKKQAISKEVPKRRSQIGAVGPKEPLESIDRKKIVQTKYSSTKEEERRAFLNSLVGKTNSHQIEPDESQVDFEAKAEKIIQEPRQNISVNHEKTPSKAEPLTKEQQRSRNLSFILSTGVVLLLLGGLVLATTSWFMFAPVIKVLFILSVSIVFGGMGVVAQKLKIKQTSFAFMALAFLFLPISVVSSAYYELFGSFFSLTGEGRDWLGVIVTGIFIAIYGSVAKKYESKLFKWITLLFVYSFMVFLVLALTGYTRYRLFSLGLLLLVISLSRIIKQKKIQTLIHFFEKELIVFQISSLSISSIWLLTTIQANFLTVVNFGLYGILFFSLSLQLKKENLALQIIGNIFLNIGILISLLLSYPVSPSIAVVVMAVLSSTFLWLSKIKRLQVISVIFIKRQVWASGLVTLIYGTLYGFSLLALNLKEPFIDQLFLGVAALIFLGGSYQFMKLTNSKFTCFYFYGMSYLTIASCLTLMQVDGIFGQRLLLISSIIGYSLIFLRKPFIQSKLMLGSASLIWYLSTLTKILWLLTAWEQTFWLVILWSVILGTTIYFKLVEKEKSRPLLEWGIPTSLVISLLPLVKNVENYGLAIAGFSLVLLILSFVLTHFKQTILAASSLVVASVIYLVSLISLVVQLNLIEGTWLNIGVLLLGILFSYLLRSHLSVKVSAIGIVLFSGLSSLYPLHLIKVTPIGIILYSQVIAVLFGIVSWKLKGNAPLIKELKQSVHWGMHSLFFISLGSIVSFNQWLTAPIIYLLPLICYGWLLTVTINGGPIQSKFSYLGINSSLMTLFLMSLGQLASFSWLDGPVISLIMALLLYGCYRGIPQLKIVASWLGMGATLIALAINTPIYFEHIMWGAFIVSLFLWFLLCDYLKDYPLKGLEIGQLLGWFTLIAWHVHVLEFKWYFLTLLLFLVINGILTWLKKAALLSVNPLQFSPNLIVTLVGISYLRIQLYIEGAVLLEACLILFFMCYTYLFARQTMGKVAKAILQTAFLVSVLDFCYWGIHYGQKFVTIPAVLTLKVTVSLIVVSLILRYVWHLSEKQLKVEWAIVALGLMILLQEALWTGTIKQFLSFTVFSLLCYLIGYKFHFKGYEYSGLIGLFVGVLSLRQLVWSDNKVIYELAIIIFTTVFLYMLTKQKQQPMILLITKTAFYLSIADLSYWMLRYFEASLYQPLYKTAQIAVAFIILSLILRRVWQVSQQYLLLEWGYVIVGMGILMVQALEVGTLSQLLVFSVAALICMITGFIFKFKSYFIVGMTTIAISLVYNQRHFWSSLPWWFYLILGGVLLIAIASSTEWRQRKKEEGGLSLVKKVVKIFEQWH